MKKTDDGTWERFGKMTPVKNADLWQRIDRAMDFHDIDCRVIRRDPPADDLTRSIPTVRNSDGLGCRAARNRANGASGERLAAPGERVNAPRRIGIGRMVRHLFGW